MLKPLGEVAAGVIGEHLYVVGDGTSETQRYDLSAWSGRPEDSFPCARWVVERQLEGMVEQPPGDDGPRRFVEQE